MTRRADPDRFYVYAHYTKDEGVLFYIGKGSGSRAWSRSNRNRKWTNIVNKHGIDVEILMCGLLEVDAFNLEERLTTKIGIHNLAAFTLGGGGTSGYEHTDDTRRRMSSSHKGKSLSETAKMKMSKTIQSSARLIEMRRAKFTGRNNPMTKEENRKLSSFRMTINNPMRNKDTIDKMRKSKSGYKPSAETRKKQSEALIGKPWSEARRAAQARKGISGHE